MVVNPYLTLSKVDSIISWQVLSVDPRQKKDTGDRIMAQRD
jgi:hypothetical protein